MHFVFNSEFPFTPPHVKIVPTSDMYIPSAHPTVRTDGTVEVSVLKNWKSSNSVMNVFEEMASSFSQKSPLHSRSSLPTSTYPKQQATVQLPKFFPDKMESDFILINKEDSATSSASSVEVQSIQSTIPSTSLNPLPDAYQKIQTVYDSSYLKTASSYPASPLLTRPFGTFPVLPEPIPSSLTSQSSYSSASATPQLPKRNGENEEKTSEQIDEEKRQLSLMLGELTNEVMVEIYQEKNRERGELLKMKPVLQEQLPLLQKIQDNLLEDEIKLTSALSFIQDRNIQIMAWLSEHPEKPVITDVIEAAAPADPVEFKKMQLRAELDAFDSITKKFSRMQMSDEEYPQRMMVLRKMAKQHIQNLKDFYALSPSST
ncbi:Vacuolar Protein Sorting 23A (Vps23) [Monocercomonoides exilis]|uniref:Vacuolar Protein Sorting 23A (Vps23) n=1 Tax=Monocercomonoides exilis TaxID=2049356 RepID=UPI0035598B94|nr:Vacuolar Protein Sorting 23A (Vps23) [Monocercomonoides exilis]|eukprot:MONOS_5847.1-p1 / transcript=MONOS_5847.1 / gene=MONOS_5847 / organism=Monocercomonoides_exilis_PA203 / gene_product=Vacuolar Protein Sorting 23A (Vps23) / transcript_product=Vacuolar Protein Sorting 23A (Vps23) / location=Mono_scaffold00175:96917-98655(-) / protein_length=373 / sequence_SO=supercontig / SO=protein_coding / is_pseudo=false